MRAECDAVSFEKLVILWLSELWLVPAVVTGKVSLRLWGVWNGAGPKKGTLSLLSPKDEIKLKASSTVIFSQGV